MFFVFIGANFPWFLLVSFDFNDRAHHGFYYVTVWLVHTATTLNPVIYAAKYPQFQKCFKARSNCPLFPKPHHCTKLRKKLDKKNWWKQRHGAPCKIKLFAREKAFGFATHLASIVGFRRGRRAFSATRHYGHPLVLLQDIHFWPRPNNPKIWRQNIKDYRVAGATNRSYW